MHLTVGGRDLFGVTFDAPWESLDTYIRAVRNQAPFGVRISFGRGQGSPALPERPYEMLDENERPVPWDISELIGDRA